LILSPSERIVPAVTRTTPVRDRIIDAAREVIRSEGADGIRLADVAGRAGVARPNLYRYFSSRAELLREVLFAEVRHIHEQRRAALTDVTSAFDLVVESLVLGAEQSRALESVTAVAGPGLDGVDQLVAGDPELMELETEYWRPILDRARGEGVLADDLDDTRVIRWFMVNQMLAVTQPDLVGDDLRAWVTRFIVPPLLPRPEEGSHR